MILGIGVLVLLAFFTSVVYAKYGYENSIESDKKIDEMIKNNQMDDYIKR